MEFKVHLKSDDAGQEGDRKYCFTLFLNSVLDGSRLSSISGHFNLRNDPVYEAGCTPGPVRMGAENLAPIGIRSLDHLERSLSLY